MLNLSLKRLQITKVKEVNESLYKRILIVDSKESNRNRTGCFLFSCVNLAMYLMGIHPWVITPYGLYKYLVHRKHENIINVEVL